MAGQINYPERLIKNNYILLSPFSRFHYWLLFVCGWANASDAVEILAISFLLPSAECDLALSPARKGWLSAILFVGMMIGGRGNILYKNYITKKDRKIRL